ncbi:MAG: hypothetical protein LBO08_02280 [Rickettsiales bacterium]|jgi:hypothetical protein|nr:hypothetical protein [Rickettsiales bacterium]
MKRLFVIRYSLFIAAFAAVAANAADGSRARPGSLSGVMTTTQYQKMPSVPTLSIGVIGNIQNGDAASGGSVAAQNNGGNGNGNGGGNSGGSGGDGGGGNGGNGNGNGGGNGNNGIKPNPDCPSQSMTGDYLLSPRTNNILVQTTLFNGTTIWTDSTTEEQWAKNSSGCLAAYNPKSDEPWVDSLGVSLGTARRACQGIYADGHQAQFDENTKQCFIPIVAHNWSGIIKKSGADVVAYAPMGTSVKCNADLFEQIDAMRRTSQWVIPTMVVGGATIGLGVGAIIDHNNDKKLDALNAKLQANVSASVNANANINAGAVGRCGDRDYVLPDEKDDLIKCLGLDKFSGTVDSGNRNKTKALLELADKCAGRMFNELISVNQNVGQKWGRIKITGTSDCKSDTEDDVKYCQFQYMHRSLIKMADCAKDYYDYDSEFSNPYNESNKSYNARGNGSYINNEKFWHSGTVTKDAGCFWRDGFGSNEVDREATIQADYYRLRFLDNYKNKPDVNGVAQPNKNLLKNFIFDKEIRNSNLGGSGTGDILNWILVKSSNNTKFSSIGNSQCNNDDINKIFPTAETYNQSYNTADNTSDRLWTIYGSLTALRDYSDSAEMPDLDELIDAIGLNIDLQMTTQSIITGIDATIQAEKSNKKPFFKTAKGTGLLIGTGVGALAGLGYYFAEGASVFCNIGGWEQVKMDRSAIIPTFREYIVKHGFVGN